MQTVAKPQILVVNDDPASLLALCALLDQHAEAAGFTVATARSGHEALRQVLLKEFAVILLDLNMPGMDGFETAEAIHQRARSADIPIIFVTAFLADELDRLKAYQKGAVDFLFTPIIPQILHAKVSVFVALANKNEQLRQQAQQLSARGAALAQANRRLTREVEERKAVERKSDAKDEFLAMLGHELRNPLSAISSAAALIGMPAASAGSAARAKGIIERQSQHLSRIVDDLLDLSRAMSGKIRLNRQPLDLALLVGACADTYRATGRSREFALSLALGSGWVDGDPTRLEQIVSNLLDNAFKYTAAGGRISVCTAQDGEQVRLTVRDSGSGIAPDLLPHVFDVFVQGSSTLDRAQGGLGIGLALVRRLVELHGGSAEVHSDGAGRGSEFTVCFPAVAAGAPAAPAPPVAAERAKPAVLLIEDNDDGREMMATMLDVCGYPVHQAADGVRGVQLAADVLPDVALVDIGLPGIDGYEVARRLRTDPATRAIGLIALTGYGLQNDERRVFEAGFDMHLVKPVDIERLLGAIGACAPGGADPAQMKRKA
ncbi:MAG: response regulator [Pseudomonadota bacterium]